MAKSLKQIEKEITYAEGILHGFGEAQQAIHEAYGGMFSLNKTENIKAWEKRERRLRDEAAVLRNLERMSTQNAKD